MNSNQKLGEQIAILASVDASSQAVGTVTSTWVPVALFNRFAALLDIGSSGAAGTTALAVLQAQDNAGTGSKALTNTITGVAVATSAPIAGNSKQAIVDFLPDWVDSNNGYGYVAVTVTVAVNAVLTSALLVGHAPRYGSAAAFNQAGVAQVI